MVREPAAGRRDRPAAGGLRTARYRCLPTAEIDLQRDGAGDRRRRALVQRDLRPGSRGGLAGGRRTPGAAGRTYFLAHAKAVSWRQLGTSAARIMARTPRVLTVPFAVAHAVGACAEVWARVQRQAGNRFAREDRRGALHGLDLRYRRAAHELGFVARTSSGRWPGRNPRLVQGGGLAEVLSADPTGSATRDSGRSIRSSSLISPSRCCLILGWWSKLPHALPLLAANVIGGAVIVYQVKRPNPTSWLFRNWYALPYVASCYKEMALFIPRGAALRCGSVACGSGFPNLGSSPVGLAGARSHSRADGISADRLHAVCTGGTIYRRGCSGAGGALAEFQYYAFLIALGFLASYLGYILVPARGPRFLLKHLQHFPLQGLWLFQTMQNTLDRLESAHYDCFPSGHTELTILAWWGSRMVSKRLSRVYLAYTPCIIFATVYLRYHYTVDLLAGMVTAAVLILTAPRLYQKLSPKGL